MYYSNVIYNLYYDSIHLKHLTFVLMRGAFYHHNIIYFKGSINELPNPSSFFASCGLAQFGRWEVG